MGNGVEGLQGNSMARVNEYAGLCCCKIDKAPTIFSRMILSQIVSNDLHDLVNLVNVLKESETIQLNTRL